MSAPQVLRVIARAVEALPEAVGNLACFGLSLLMVGGCTVVMIRADPMYGWILGGIAAFWIVPGLLRWIADVSERRSEADEASRAEISGEPPPDEPSLERGYEGEIDPRDFTEPDPPARGPGRR